jgi:hypothetical protein
METSQGNSLCSYLKQTKMSIFFFYKIREQEGRTGPVGGQVSECRRVNIVQILYTKV